MDKDRLRSRAGLAALALALAVAATATLAAGCKGSGAGEDKAGGSGGPVVLRMADGYEPGLDLEPAVAYFVKRVEQLSHGSLRIHVVDGWGNQSPGFEQQIVRDVAAGKADLGWAGTRVFDTLGVRSFQALTAPMLIDSYPLERAVVGSDIPAQMLPGLDKVKLKGLGVLADGLRRPIAVKGPLLGPRDWRGLTFAVFRSSGQDDAIRALGARPTNRSGPALQQGIGTGTIGGFEKHFFLWPLVLNVPAAPYATANVNLWPQTVALFANPRRLSRLSDGQRGWLRQAAADAAARSTSFFDREAPVVKNLCKLGGRFSNASQADLTALRRAFAPVYARLEQDPQTKSFIARIRELKRSTRAAPPLTIPARCAGPAPSAPAVALKHTSAGVLNGVYRVRWSEQELRSAGGTGDWPRKNSGVLTMTLRDGGFRFHYPRPPECPLGTYAVSGAIVTIKEGPGCQNTVLTARWSLGRGALRLRVLRTTDRGDRLIYGGKPWQKIADVDSGRRTIPDGIYRTMLSEAFLLGAGVNRLDASHSAGLQDLVLKGRRFTNKTENKWHPPDCSGDISYAGGRATFSADAGPQCGTGAGGPLFSAHWSLEHAELRFTDVLPDDVSTRALWGGEPWRKLG